jgi:hypothetical protein
MNTSRELELKEKGERQEITQRYNIKSKAISVTGRGGLQVCEMLRVSHCLDNRLTDGALRVGRRFTPQKHYFCVSGTHFC